MGFLTKTRLAACGLALACVPEFESDLSLVDAPRVLALRSEPAEAAPGQTVTVHALVAEPDGTHEEAELAWSLCLARRPLTTLAPIAPECAALLDDPEILEALGSGPSVIATLPTDACRRFGPEPPPATPGEPTGRPVDPDPTGGYYQPILARLLDDDTVNLLQTRLTCGLAGATQAQAAEFQTRYQANVAPAIERVRLLGDDLDLLDVDPPPRVEPEQRVELRVSWIDCPSEPSCGDDRCSLDERAECPSDCDAVAGCPGAETHVYFNPLALELDTRREAIAVAWYSSAGRLGEARTGRAEDDHATHSDNTWVAPRESGLARFWVVLRDDRGGVGWARFALEVE